MQRLEIKQSIRHLFVIIFQQSIVENFNDGGLFIVAITPTIIHNFLLSLHRIIFYVRIF